MKLKGVLLTTALTAMLGVGVFAGASNNRSEPVEKTEAATPSGFNLYLDPGCWNAGGAGYAVWAWGGAAGSGTVYKLSAAGSTGLSYLNINSNVTDFIFFRMAPNGFNALTNGSTSWPTQFSNNNDNGYWNKTGDTNRGSDNLFTISDWGAGSWSSREVASEDGYYVVGHGGVFTFAAGTKMTFNSDYSPLDSGDIAVKYEYIASTDEQIKVRSFKDHKDEWYNAGSGTGAGYGSVQSNGNFKFNSSANNKKFDIFFNGTNFYVTLHKERYTVTIVHKLYDGSIYTGQEAGVNQMATETETFNPSAQLTKENYVRRGYFTDESCTTEYIPNASHTTGFTLYVKFTRICYYLFGDDTFAGGTGRGWNVDYATPVSAGTDGNRLQGAAVIPTSASSQNPVAVKPLLWDGSMQPEYYTLGESKPFVSLDGSGNFSFTEGGTYAFYINSENKVYFNSGEYAFHAKFLDDTGEYCDANGVSTPIASLQTAWGLLKKAYNESLTDAERLNIYNVGFNGGNKDSSDDRLKMVARYNYIVSKYGTSKFEDFIWNQTIAGRVSSAFAGNLPSEASTAATTAATVVASVMAIATATGFLFLKKKKISK